MVLVLLLIVHMVTILYVKKPWSLKEDKDNYYNYVGFIDKSKTSHPDGSCQACCYKRPKCTNFC